MDEVEVKVVELQIRKRFFESFERCLVTAASIPDLAGYENVFTLDAGILDPAADAALVVVDRGGVNMTVAGFNGFTHSIFCSGTVGRLPGAKADAWNFDAVFQSEGVGRMLKVHFYDP